MMIVLVNLREGVSPEDYEHWHAGAAAATVLISAFGTRLPPVSVLLSLALVFVALVLANIYSWETWHRPYEATEHDVAEARKE